MGYLSFLIMLISAVTIFVVFTDKIKSLSPYAYNIKKLDNAEQKEIIISYNKKGWNTVSVAFILFSISVFGDNYFLPALTLLIYFVALSGEYSKRIHIIKNISDNSLIVREQAILKEENFIFSGDENLSVEILRISYVKAYFKDENRSALAMVSNSKTALLRFVSPPYLGVAGRIPLSRYRDVIMLGNKEIQDISIFLNFPLLSESGDLTTVLKEKGLR